MHGGIRPYPVPSTASEPAGVHASTTVISLRVSVPGLVGADERGGPEGLDGLEVAHEDAAARHPLGPPERQRERDGRQQALGNERDRHADREDEGVADRVADEHRDEQEQRAGADGDDRGQADHAAQARVSGVSGFAPGQPGDAGEPGLPAGRGDARARVALDDEGAREERLALGDLAGLALAGEHRRVDEQPVRVSTTASAGTRSPLSSSSTSSTTTSAASITGGVRRAAP